MNHIPEICFSLRNPLLVLLLIPSLLLGCSLFEEEPEKLTLDTEYDRTFDVVQEVLSNRYPLKTTDRNAGKIVTEWRVKPSSTGSERMRLFAHVKESENQPKDLDITLRSERQTVENIIKPFETEDVKWDDAGRNRKLEKDLLQVMRFRLESEQIEQEIIEDIEEREEKEKRLKQWERDE